MDHLLSSITPYTLAFITRVAEECDLPGIILSRLLAGSLPFITKAENDQTRISCCAFITQIMKNFTEKEEITDSPFPDSVFEPIFESLRQWFEQKPMRSLVLRDRALESMTWLCHGLPWTKDDELIRLLKSYQSVLRENRSQINLVEPFFQLLSISVGRNPRLGDKIS